MKLDSKARYAKTHEWARKDGDSLLVGISDHAQDSLGDIVYIDLPEASASFAAGENFGVVESVKAASDLYLPVAGTIKEVNQALSDQPDLINKDCYGEGWILRISPEDDSAFDSLLSPEAYEKLAAED